MIIKTVMNKPIVIDKDIYLSKAANIMTLNNISSLIFVKDKKPIGVITKGDIVKHYGKNLKVSKIMSNKLYAAFPDDKINTAIDIMQTNGVSVIPILNKKRDLIGIVSAKDLLYKACGNEEFLFG